MYPLTKDIPKPMVNICGKPILHYLVDWAKNNNIKEIELKIKELTDKKLLSIYDYLNLFEEKENIEKEKGRTSRIRLAK